VRATLKRHLVLLFLFILMNPVPARATPAPRPEALGPWTVHLLEEGLVHLELGPEPGAPIPISPYVDGCDYPGRYPGASARRGDDALTTSRMTLRPRGRSLEVLNAGRLVLTLQATENGYRLEAPETRNLLGLGEQFPPEREEVEGTNLALSGIDYFGSDVGGFFREVFPGTPEELEALYTRWFAAACAIDVPIRPHAFNLENRHATSPDRIGHVDSNRENLRWRYRLLPYYYSLAHEAARSGQPLVAPAACWFPGWESPAALAGHVKMIGPELLVALSADLRAERMDLELPPGDWMDLRTGARLQGRTDWSLKRDGRFELPLLARAGSILPMMVVDQDTTNAQGRRLHGPPVADLLLRVHSAPRAGRFLLTEDDGETRGWRRGELVTTELTRELRQDEEVVRIAPRQGTWSGAPSRRAVKVELVPPPGMAVRRATLNGTSLKLQRQGHLVVVHTDPLDPGRPAEFRFRLASSR